MEYESLHSIDGFGAIDADDDDLLRDCFEDHPAYRSALAHDRFLVVGRKGSGKTAIFRKFITTKRHNYFCFGHTFTDYPWEYHDLQARSGVPEELRYVESWKYLVLVSLAKILLNQDHSVPWSDESAESSERLEDFIVDSYGSRDPDLTQLFQPNKEIKLKGTLKVPFVDIAGERIRVRDLPARTAEVNRAVREYIMATLNPEHDYYICFDQLDREFLADDPKYAQRVTGLILAARDLSLSARESGKRLSVVVFLRDDIYQLLHFEDKNKLSDRRLSHIRWDVMGPDLTLRKVMETRFSRVLGRSDGSVSWDEVFDETKQMPGRQSKYSHICDRTFRRPRDVIRFCNEILSVYKRDEGSSGLFENAVVAAAREGYSDYLLQELDDEIAKQVPLYDQYLDILRDISTIQFNWRHFYNRWTLHPALSKSGIDPREALRDLFDFSVIGFLRPGGGTGGSQYLWKYRDARVRLSPEAETFRVHPGFKEALDLTKGRHPTIS